MQKLVEGEAPLQLPGTLLEGGEGDTREVGLGVGVVGALRHKEAKSEQQSPLAWHTLSQKQFPPKPCCPHSTPPAGERQVVVVVVGGLVGPLLEVGGVVGAAGKGVGAEGVVEPGHTVAMSEQQSPALEQRVSQ